MSPPWMPGGIPTATRPSRTPCLPCRAAPPALPSSENSNSTATQLSTAQTEPPSLLASRSHHQPHLQNIQLPPLLTTPFATTPIRPAVTSNLVYQNSQLPPFGHPLRHSRAQNPPGAPRPSLQGPMGPGPQLLLPSRPLPLPPALMLLPPQQPLCHAPATSAVLPSRAPDAGSPARGTSSAR